MFVQMGLQQKGQTVGGSPAVADENVVSWFWLGGWHRAFVILYTLRKPVLVNKISQHSDMGPIAFPKGQDTNRVIAYGSLLITCQAVSLLYR
jgi:hypothetical protein